MSSMSYLIYQSALRNVILFTYIFPTYTVNEFLQRKVLLLNSQHDLLTPWLNHVCSEMQILAQNAWYNMI